MKATPAAAGSDPAGPASTGAWPALIFTLIVAAAAAYAFSPRPAPPFAPTAVHPDGLLVDGLARDGDRLLAVGEQGRILVADSVKGPWHEATVDPQRGSTLTKVKFIDDKLVLAVGHDGWILRSTDRGEHWKEAFFIPTPKDADEDSPSGAIAPPPDAGSSAEPPPDAGMSAEPPPDASMSAEPPGDVGTSAEPPADDGSAGFGGDSGPEPLQPDPLLGIAGPFNDRIFAVGGFGLMLKSDDQGQTWQRVVSEAVGDHHLSAMVRAADGALILVGERGLMARSTDNGDNWQLLPQVYDGSFFGVLALKSKSLLAFGMRGHVFRSEDDGKTWKESKVPSGSSLFGGNVSADGDVVLVGAGSTVLVSKDDGRSFTQPLEPAFSDLATVLPVSADSWLVGGDGGLKLVTSAAHDKETQP
ncbi:WD40/YVTN/BNR-like repeat-containing protein [Solimonas terrae]|uniref:Uncharacterized protein n=1 Tax=Solimonas terrae TaxID=1396819 RepID=A0A6M2BR87_9GAMM|nr:YCF48-related protein [Solimonas terrae]NGY04840.1 hypothetical protein [Solimonas terrae]